MATDHIETIQGMYEAFGRGDVPAILANLTEDIDWAADGPADAAPWYGTRTGHDQVQQFFVDFGNAVEVSEFAPQRLGANDSDVFALVDIRGGGRATGKPIQMHLHHYFRFRDGKVAYYRGSEDTAQVVAALAA